MGAAPLDVQEIDAGGHRVVLGTDALSALDHMLGELTRVSSLHVLGDENTLRHCLPSLLASVPRLSSAGTIAVPPGEGSKSLEVAQAIWHHLATHEADRNAVVLCLGGGVVTDLGGFVAATYKRGIRFIHLPTSLMGMVDAALGGKNGLDLGGVKNMVGTFADPLAVFVHVPFLKSLGKRELLNGLAEMIKHGLVHDAAHWEAIHGAALHDLEAITPLVHRSVAIKAAIVKADPRERGLRRVLNFGHTIGHGIEARSWEGQQRSLLHGEAIAIGMICASWLSSELGLLDRSAHERIAAQLLDLYKPYPIDQGDHHRILALMRNDKKNRDGGFRFTLLTGIGSGRVDVAITAAQVEKALDHYRHLALERF